MALEIRVTNNTDGVRGRAGYRFDAGETKTVTVAVARANELLDAKDLDTAIVGADSMAEVPKGYDIDVQASESAKKRARELGVDILEVKGTGKDGNVKVEDVESAAGDLPVTRHEHWMRLHQESGGSATVSTLSPLDEQIAAQHRALEELHAAEERQRREAGEIDPPGAQPDQTGQPDEPMQASVVDEASPGNVEDVASNPDAAPKSRPSGG